MTIQSLTEDYGSKYFDDLDLSELRMDEAYLKLYNLAGKPLYLYSLNEECHKCPFLQEYGGTLNGNVTIKISTRFNKIYRLLDENLGVNQPEDSLSTVCEYDKNDLGEFGVYSWETDGDRCDFNTLKEPVNIYLPILTVFLIYSTLILIPIFFYLRKRLTTGPKKDCDEAQITKKPRLKSLDTFRGISIVLMIFVNYGGGGYVFMDHAVWNGLQVADLVFPWFMWIMGVCIPMSIVSSVKKDVPRRTTFLAILRRSCILFAIGIFLGGGINLNRLRVFGVLQRFGIAYFVVANLCLFFMVIKDYTYDGKNNWKYYVADLRKTFAAWIVVLLILLLHCLLIFLMNVPDCPRGYLGPGGYHKNGASFNCTGGVTGYVDEIILGRHVFRYPTILEIYKSKPFDPEGILGCLTSIVQVFVGVQAGMILLEYKTPKQRLIRWLIWGVTAGLIGGALCGFVKEDGAIPINKNLWSLSFVLVTSGLAFLLLAACYVLVDVVNVWSGKPFLYAGMNAILMYIGHSMTYSNFPIRWSIEETSTHFVTLIENVWATLMWILISFYLYKKRYFFSV